MRAGFAFTDYPGMAVGRSEEGSYDVSWYQAYGTVDLSFLRITGAYCFDGLETYGGGQENALGSGFTLSVRLIFGF